MNELLKKYESIDQSKLNDGAIKILNRVKTLTSEFSTDDAKNNKIAEDVLNEIIKKYPDSVKIVKRTPKAKPAPKKVAKAKKPATVSTAKKSGNNIMTVAKEIQKAGESWKEAMERAKQVLKDRREQVVQKQKTELEKLYALVKTKKELQGFTKSDIQRDAVRTAKPTGARFVTKQGFTSNQHGVDFPNKLGRKYWETRDRHADRLAPNYPKDTPLLASGGALPNEYVSVVRWADGNYRVQLKRESMAFGRYFNDSFEDKERAEKFAKKISENNKVNYIGISTLPYDFRKSNIPEKEFLEKYYQNNEFSYGGSVTETMIVNMPDGSDIKVETKSGTISKISKRVSVNESKNSVLFYKLPADLQQKINKRLNPDALANGGGIDGGMSNLTMQNVSFAKGGKVKHTFKVGEIVSFPTQKNRYMDKPILDMINHFSNKELVIEKINEDKPYNLADVYIKDTGEKLRNLILNPKVLKIYPDNVEDEKSVKIKDWYLENYPSDDLGEELNDEVTFEDMWNEDYKKYDIYQVMGVGDSLIRERLFEHLAEIKGVSYDVVYRKLFSNIEYAKGGSVSNERMYNFLQDDLEKLEKAINEDDTEQVETFFSYWLGSSGHLKSLETKTNERMYNFLKDDLEKLEKAINDGDKEQIDIFFSYWGQHLESLKMANGGSLPFMTDPNFGNFQNTGAFAEGGYFDKLQDVRFLFSVGEKIKVPQMGKRKLELLDAEIIEQYPAEQNDGTYYPFYYVKGTWENSGKLLYDEEELLEFGNKPNKSFSDGGNIIADTVSAIFNPNEKDGKIKTTFGDKTKTGFFEMMTSVNNTPEEITSAIFIPNEKTGRVYTEFGAKTKKGLYEMINNMRNTFELGGAFMMTDLAGHTGGSDGVGIPKPLSGVSGTYYTGLVGETGAMSSGELFMDGGAMAQNQQVINDASQSYVNYYLGEGASQGIYKDGGSIPNNYEGRTAEDVWNSLSQSQRFHFLTDHNKSEIQTTDYSLEEFSKKKYRFLSEKVKKSFDKHIQTGQYASGGSLGKALYVAYSSYFDSNKYDEEKIMSALKSIGAKNIHLENDGGMSNQPEVVVFNGSKRQAEDALNEAFDTDYILIYEKDWRTKKMADGGSVDYYEQLAVYVQGKGSIYNGTSMKKALEKANSYLKNNPKAEIAIVDEKYGDEYDFYGNLKDDYAKGGSVGTVEFNAGDIVWQKDDKRYATVMNNYGDPVNGDYGEVRLDTTGNTSIYTYDKKYQSTGYNLVKLGEKGDTGKFTPEVVAEMKESANRLIDSRKERDDTEMIEYYEGIYKRLLDGEFDSMTGAKSTASNKKGSRDYTYVPNKDVKELSVVVKGELKKLMGSDILDGVYVKNSAKSATKVDANAVFAKILKDAKEAKSGKTKRFEASDLKKINVEMVQKLVDAGYTEQQVRNVIFGYAFDNEIVADNELEYDNGIFSYEESYVKEKIDDLVEAQKNKEFVAGIEYPDFDWQGIIKKYKISSKPKNIVIKRNFPSGGYNEYHYEVFVGENIALGHQLGYKEFDSNGKLTGDYIEKGKKVSDITKQNAWQKERGQKAGFNGGYWYVVSSKIETIDDVLKTLLSQKGGYCKELELYSDSFPKTLKENKIDFADGGFMNNVYAKHKGGEKADIQKMKKALIAKAKSKGIYENFGQNEVRDLQDKYGYTNSVREFDNWAMNFDLSQMADGGNLMGVHDGTAFMENPIYADRGSYLEDNDGFMKADNEFNYRYPTKDVYIETLDEPIDLTDNAIVKIKEVSVETINDDIDLNEDGRVKVRMGYEPEKKNPEKFGEINPRAFEFMNLPMPTSNEHKND
jgi:hypothetical protein